MKIDLIGAATDLGVIIDGSDKGPGILLNHFNKYEWIKFTSIISKKDIKKSIDINDKEKNLDAINEFNARLYNKVLESKINGNIPITIGGDHSLSIASALASIKKEENLGIIWIDSHGDYNTFETTISGNLHGLPLAALTNFKCQKLTSFHKGNFYKPINAVIIGGRDIDPWEMPNIIEAGITLFTTDDIRTYGVKYVVDEAIRIASNNTNGIHISYDIDIIDPKIAPGVSMPATDGIDEKAAKEIADNVLKYKDLIKSLDLVEFNPTRDIDKKTEQIAVNILEKIIKEFP